MFTNVEFGALAVRENGMFAYSGASEMSIPVKLKVKAFLREHFGTTFSKPK